MPDLGERTNVMGPQPIAARTAMPAAMTAAADRVMRLLMARDAAGLAAMAAPSGLAELAEIGNSVTGGVYDRCEIIAVARLNRHYYVKGRLHGAKAEPFTLQFRIGQHDGAWQVWEAMNLSGRRGAWTR